MQKKTKSKNPFNPLTRTLKVTERQLNVIREALELFDRLLMGQIENQLWTLYALKKTGELDHDEFSALCSKLKLLVFPELHLHEYYGVGWKENDSRQQVSQIAYEIEAMIRHVWHKEREEKEGQKQPWSTSARPPLHYSTESFIELEKIEKE